MKQLNKIYFVLLLMIFFIDGCSFIVGGNCDYRRDNGYVEILYKRANKCDIGFYPQQGIWREWNQKLSQYLTIDNCKYNVGQKFPAVLKVSESGSCKPIDLRLYTTQQLVKFLDKKMICIKNKTLEIDYFNEKKLYSILDKYKLLKGFDENISLEYGITLSPNSKYFKKEVLSWKKHRLKDEYFNFDLGIFSNLSYDNIKYTDKKYNNQFNCDDDEFEIDFFIK